MNLPPNIGREFISMTAVMHEDGSMRLSLVKDKPIKLTRDQVLDLYLFFTLPGVKEMMDCAFLEEQHKDELTEEGDRTVGL